VKKDEILEEYANRVSVQQYGGKTQIDGVMRLPVPYHVDDGGDFCEIGRFNGEGLTGVEDFELKQVSYSYVQPGVVKAWHLHFKQTDVWFVPPRGQLLVALHDLRNGSTSAKQTMRFVLGGSVSELLVIPPGVAHGMANPYFEPSCMMYFTNQQFDKDNPDEHRLPWDFLGKNFWELKRE
jgi:dTDP-4-dehydrorhamnose 3,5-epimerase